MLNTASKGWRMPVRVLILHASAGITCSHLSKHNIRIQKDKKIIEFEYSIGH